jgi:ABC-type lipopolysaccharide export system ATPase subunit
MDHAFVWVSQLNFSVEIECGEIMDLFSPNGVGNITPISIIFVEVKIGVRRRDSRLARWIAQAKKTETCKNS